MPVDRHELRAVIQRVYRDVARDPRKATTSIPAPSTRRSALGTRPRLWLSCPARSPRPSRVLGTRSPRGPAARLIRSSTSAPGAGWILSRREGHRADRTRRRCRHDPAMLRAAARTSRSRGSGRSSTAGPRGGVAPPGRGGGHGHLQRSHQLLPDKAAVFREASGS